MNRLGTLVGEQNEEAKESADLRGMLFRRSLTLTLEHPILGVGPDQFSNYQDGTHESNAAMWRATHCAWTQVSSECGLPGLVFFVGGLFSSLFGVWRTYKMARQRGFSDIQNACFCYIVAMIGFMIAFSFLSLAYSVIVSIMVGVGIAISRIGMQEMSKPAAVPFQPVPVRY
jgi:O-antigen ligase